MIGTALATAAIVMLAAVPVSTAQAVSGPAITLVARQHDGLEAVDVTGKAPSGSLVTVVESAKLSVDLPIVVLRRVEVSASPSGDFSVLLPTAPDFTPGTELRFAASAAGAAVTTVRFVVGKPTSEPIVESMDDLDYP